MPNIVAVPMKATRGVIIDPATVPRIETKIASRPDPQRVYIVGSGAVGLTYGSRLLESGHEVTFLMRRDYDTVREKVCKPHGSTVDLRTPWVFMRCLLLAGAVVMGGQGLQVLSPDGNLFFSKPSVVRSSEEYESVSQGRAADWVILALKSTSFKEVRSTTTTTSRLEGNINVIKMGSWFEAFCRCRSCWARTWWGPTPACLC